MNQQKRYSEILQQISETSTKIVDLNAEIVSYIKRSQQITSRDTNRFGTREIRITPTNRRNTRYAPTLNNEQD